MKKSIYGMVICAAAVSTGAFADNASESNKPQGFRFLDGRLTIKPYVSLSYTYDSNIDTTRRSTSDSIFCVQPGADFVWRGERWELTGDLWYRYNAYCKYNNTMGENSYGEYLKYTWSNVSEEGRGWNLMLAERYALINQSDSLTAGDGRGIWRDRERFDFSGTLERRFNDRWHAAAQGQYDWIDYKNDKGKYAPLYGWSQWSAGLDAGYAASKWTDLIVAGGYSHYLQKKARSYDHRYSNESEVYTIQGGIGTHATEKITYRVLGGVSWLDYGGHGGTDCGWTYSLTANWRITRQLQASVLGSSFYQPSERSLGQAVKVYSISGGLSYLTLGDRMTLTADVAYRKEDNVYNDRWLTAGNDFGEDILSARLGANYTFNRWVSVFANLCWEEEWADGRASHDYDYDRFRFTLGLRLHY